MITIGEPYLIPASRLSGPQKTIAVTDLSGIYLYAAETSNVPGLEEALGEATVPYAVVVAHPNSDTLQVYPATDEEDALESIYDIEYQIADVIFG